jgi:hypothetical protein
MKKFIYLFTYLFIIQSCNAQKHDTVDIKRKNLLVFNLLNDNIKLSLRESIYSKNKTIVTSSIWANEDMGTGFFARKFIFIQKNDTMYLICNYCGRGGHNYYFKNLKFQKGGYEINYNYSKKYNEKEKRYENDLKYVLGAQIKTPKEVQGVLLKNAYVSPKKPAFQDLYFKDLKFYEIDLQDKINVQLKQLE